MSALVGAPAVFGASPRLLIVAHRAANELAALRRAEATGVDLVEADIWYWRGRLEVRHLKTLGRVPLLWDKWRLEGSWRPRLLFDDVVRAAQPATEFMFDLKGRDRALPPLLRATMERLAAGRRYTVSSQSWRLLEPFRSLDAVRVVHSVGNARMLRALPHWLAGGAAAAVAIDHRALTPARAEALRRMTPTLFAWSVNDVRRADELVSWGVNGIISDAYTLYCAQATA